MLRLKLLRSDRREPHRDEFPVRRSRRPVNGALRSGHRAAQSANSRASNVISAQAGVHSSAERAVNKQQKRIWPRCLGLGIIAALVASFAFTFDALAQESVPVGNVSNGVLIYQERCANCHGPLGLGNGELAAQAGVMPTALSDPEYVRGSVPSIQYDVIENGRIARGMPLFGAGSSNPLSEQEMWDVIAATHALGTRASDLLEAEALVTDEVLMGLESADFATQSITSIANTLPLPEAQAIQAALWGRTTLAENHFLGEREVTGRVVNQTTGEPLANIPVSLTAFEEFDTVQTLAARTDADGNYAFTLDNYPADWVLRADVNFGGLNYQSDFVRFEPSGETSLDAPLAVFDQSADLALLALPQLRVIGELIGDQIIVNELYVFENQGEAVFAGEAPILLPPNITDIGFFRLVGNGEFVPVPNMQPMDRGFNYVNPILPNQPLELLVRYAVPYDGGAAVTHDLAFTPGQATLALPEGIEMTAAGWRSDGLQTIQGEDFAAFSAEIPLTTLTLTLDGQSRFTIDPATGNRVPLRNERQELIVGGVALALIIGVCAYLIALWQSAEPRDPADILAEIAALDEAYAANQIKRKPYEQRRRTLVTKARDALGEP